MIIIFSDSHCQRQKMSSETQVLVSVVDFQGSNKLSKEDATKIYLSATPVSIHCPRCNKNIETRVTKEDECPSFCVCVGIFLVSFFFFLCLFWALPIFLLIAICDRSILDFYFMPFLSSTYVTTKTLHSCTTKGCSHDFGYCCYLPEGYSSLDELAMHQRADSGLCGGGGCGGGGDSSY